MPEAADHIPPDLPSDEHASQALGEALFNVLRLTDDPSRRKGAIDQLKVQADHYWGKDPRVSLVIAQTMIEIGKLCQEPYYTALGTMVYGDTLRVLSRNKEAYEILGQAGDMFKAISDEVGWGRTRSGRLIASEAIGIEAIRAARQELDQAIRIFVQHRRLDLVGRAIINLAAFLQNMGDFGEAETTLNLGLGLLGDSEPMLIAMMRLSLGLVLRVKGDHRAARAAFEEARAYYSANDQPQIVALVELYRASMDIEEGNFVSALRRLTLAKPTLSADNVLQCESDIVICYSNLGDWERARRLQYALLAKATVLVTPSLAGKYYRQLARIESELGHYRQAMDALAKAEALFTESGAEVPQNDLIVRRALVQLKHDGLTPIPEIDPQTLISQSTSADHYENYLKLHLATQIALRNDEPQNALKAALRLREIGKSAGHPPSIYSALMVFGRLRQAQGRTRNALFHYQRATQLTLHAQRDLTLDLRPYYLESVQESLHASMRIHLAEMNGKAAFAQLEQIKAMVLWQYLAASDHAAGADAGDSDGGYLHKRQRLVGLLKGDLSEAFDGERRQLEQAIAEYSEQHRLFHHLPSPEVEPPSLDKITERLAPTTVLIAYYVSGKSLYAFAIHSSGQINLYPLTSDVLRLTKQLSELRRLINKALAVGQSDAWELYGNTTAMLLSQLHELLLAPLKADCEGKQRLYISPYGFLHGFPFHMLSEGLTPDNRPMPFLGEQYEIVVLPSSSLVVRETLHRPAGVLALGYDSNDDHLRMHEEAQHICQLVGGHAHVGSDATIDRLAARPVQILHIAAHAEYNPHLPHFSPIHLAGGPAYADDFLNYDLSYGLVTLSACETGVARPSGGEELIGLGRVFLYRGAQAILTSSWRAEDSVSSALMSAFYGQLKLGANKAAALRYAQSRLIEEQRTLHPAYWAVHQLIGDPAPLLI